MGSVEIKRDIEKVFDFLSSPKMFFSEDRNVEVELGEEQLTLGSAFTAVVKTGPLQVQVTYRVTDYYRPVRIAFEQTHESGEGINKIHERWDLERVAGGTKVTHSLGVGRWIEWMIPFGLLRRLAERRGLRKLKERIEQGVEP